VRADVDTKAIVLEAGTAFVAVASSLPTSALGAPATSAWTLRELVAHATRGLLTIETTVANPVDPGSPELPDATAYFEVAMSHPQVHAGIEQRARDAAAAVGDDPGGYATAALERVTPAVEAMPVDCLVQHAAGRLRFGDYLATRVVELTLHTADLQLAVGRPVELPDEPSRLTRDVLLPLVGRVDALAVACALTGRQGPACNVLG
jgi:Mycothiol maleylpyruvate isomerase N-terminal domain